MNIYSGNILNPVQYVYKKWKDSDDQSLKYYYLNDNWYSLGTDGNLVKETKADRLTELGNNTGDGSAKDYVEKYKNESGGFTKWVTDNLGNLEPALNFDGDNDPDKYSSLFNEHRRKIIQESIKTNLEATVVNYFGSSNTSTFEFQMPELDETEWDKIINNVSLISFMQGLPLKNKYYRGYSVVTNTESKEFVDPDEIYLLTEKGGMKQYHKVTWEGFQKTNTDIEETNIKASAYRNIDFRRKSYVNNTTEIAQKNYYYPHYETADYESIVASKNVITADKENEEENEEENDIEVAMENIKAKARKAYYTALYRERYINYKSLNF